MQVHVYSRRRLLRQRPSDPNARRTRGRPPFVLVEFLVTLIHQRLIVVLGMHRSGTSAMTRALQAMGVELGSRLMPPVEGENDKGFWEDLELNALNIEVLA